MRVRIAVIITSLIAASGLVYAGVSLTRAVQRPRRPRSSVAGSDELGAAASGEGGRATRGRFGRVFERLTDPYRDRRDAGRLRGLEPNASPGEDELDEGEYDEASDALRGIATATAGLGLVVVGSAGVPLAVAGGIICLVGPYAASARTALVDLRDHRRVGFDMLNTVSLAGVFASGFIVWGAVGLTFGSVVRWLVARAHAKTRSSLVDVFGGLPSTAWRIDGSERIRVPVETLRAGDVIEVVAGGILPVDGVVSAGAGLIDQSMLTGESQPVEAEPGQPVLASAIMLSGQLHIRVDKAGTETAAAGIAELLRSTTASADRRPWIEGFEHATTVPMLGAAALCLPLLGASRALAFLWYAPGYRMAALGPMNTLNHLYIASRQGLLVKEGYSFDRLATIDTVLFDKTGTMTVEQPAVRRWVVSPDVDRGDVLRWALTAEQAQSHPIATALCAAARAEGVEPAPLDDITVSFGLGIEARVEGRRIALGSPRFVERSGFDVPAGLRAVAREAGEAGNGVVFMAVDGIVCAAIELAARLRPDAIETVTRLQAAGKSVMIVSGDHEAPTARLAEELGVDGWFAETLPDQKADIVRQLKREGRKVCFVGDGINDALALTAADISISLQGATTAAINSAQVVALGGRLDAVNTLFEIGETYDDIVRGSVLSTVVPNALGLATVIFAGAGLPSAIGLTAALWLPQLGYVMRPLLTFDGAHATQPEVQEET